MIFNVLNKINNILPFEKVYAHCDIPCKIYDPINAQISVLTMIRIIDLIEELESKTELNLDDRSQFTRLIAQKEEHGLKVKEEVRVIWGDYIKKDQIEQFPEIHDLTHSIMLNASKAKQQVNRKITIELLEKINRFAEIFWKCKGIETYRAVCPYPPSQEIIYPDLKVL